MSLSGQMAIHGVRSVIPWQAGYKPYGSTRQIHDSSRSESSKQRVRGFLGMRAYLNVQHEAASARQAIFSL